MVIIGDTADPNSALCIRINNQMNILAEFHRTSNDLTSVLKITPLKPTKSKLYGIYIYIEIHVWIQDIE